MPNPPPEKMGNLLAEISHRVARPRTSAAEQANDMRLARLTAAKDMHAMGKTTTTAKLDADGRLQLDFVEVRANRATISDFETAPKGELYVPDTLKIGDFDGPLQVRLRALHEAVSGGRLQLVELHSDVALATKGDLLKLPADKLLTAIAARPEGRKLPASVRFRHTGLPRKIASVSFHYPRNSFAYCEDLRYAPLDEEDDKDNDPLALDFEPLKPVPEQQGEPEDPASDKTPCVPARIFVLVPSESN
jgi:hypothetical protein